jgi:hypothetical protein
MAPAKSRGAATVVIYVKEQWHALVLRQGERFPGNPYFPTQWSCCREFAVGPVLIALGV